jgi:hypothetical protein
MLYHLGSLTFGKPALRKRRQKIRVRMNLGRRLLLQPLQHDFGNLLHQY